MYIQQVHLLAIPYFLHFGQLDNITINIIKSLRMKGPSIFCCTSDLEMMKVSAISWERWGTRLCRVIFSSVQSGQYTFLSVSFPQRSGADRFECIKAATSSLFRWILPALNSRNRDQSGEIFCVYDSFTWHAEIYLNVVIKYYIKTINCATQRLVGSMKVWECPYVQCDNKSISFYVWRS